METEFLIDCPYCAEPIWQEFYIQDGKQQETIIDCEVCCRPIHFKVDFSSLDGPTINADLS